MMQCTLSIQKIGSIQMLFHIPINFKLLYINMSILGLVYLASSETCALAPQAAPNDILSEALAFWSA